MSSDAPGPFPTSGAYLNYGTDGVRRMTEFQRWLGGVDLKVGHTYLPGDRWSNIEGRPSFLEAWAQWRRERPDRLLILNVPMMERNEDHLSDQEVRGLLARGADAVPWPNCYPGDDAVDIIGMDTYDQPPGTTFDEQTDTPYGLRDHVEFAKAHGKPISYPEWGLFRNGDNPEYMRRMLAWIDEHKPVYNTITDYCPHGVWQCGQNPKSSEVYRSRLSGR
jgi:hypothetical protein